MQFVVPWPQSDQGQSAPRTVIPSILDDRKQHGKRDAADNDELQAMKWVLDRLYMLLLPMRLMDNSVG
jgi:hypothetical protein